MTTTNTTKNAAMITLPKWKLAGDSKVDIANRLINTILQMGHARVLKLHSLDDQMLTLVHDGELSAEVILTKVLPSKELAVAITAFSEKDPRVKLALDFVAEQQSRMSPEQISSLNAYFWQGQE